MRAAALALLVTLLLAPAALAAAPRASLPDVEDEVMCLQCGTALNVSSSAVADRERAFIRRLIVRGKTKAQIKQALVAEFGTSVLAVPDDKGFDVANWLVPLLLVAGGAVTVIVVARRWRRSNAAPAAADAGDGDLSPEDQRRLDAELAAYDR